MDMLVIVLSVAVLLLVGYIGFSKLWEKLKILEVKLNTAEISNNRIAEDVTAKIIESQKQQTKPIIKYLQYLDQSAKKLETIPRKNDIEKREPEDIPLDESMRIPIIDGVNIGFEDEDTRFPIGIIAHGNETT